MRRRTLIAGGAAGALAYAVAARQHRRPLEPAPVAVIKAGSYTADFERIISQGFAACGISLENKLVLVKPNLVEYAAGSVIHTHPSVLAGCIAALQSMGATVMVGEGPGHRRDTLDMARSAGYAEVLPDLDSRFIDLNLDDVRPVQLANGPESLYLPESALHADVIVSLAKMKTHHWAGATLSMKNLFGIVPGAVYGWPKNHLHFLGIDQTVAALYRLFPNTIGIVDGVIGMEGNGPIQGRPTPSGAIVIGSDLSAVDATCCRLMRIDPSRVGYLRAVDGERCALDRIEQRAESVQSLARTFELPPKLSHLRLAS